MGDEVELTLRLPELLLAQLDRLGIESDGRNGEAIRYLSAEEVALVAIRSFITKLNGDAEYAALGTIASKGSCDL